MEKKTHHPKRRFFYRLKMKLAQLLSKPKRFKNPGKSLQWIPRDIWKLLKIKYPHGHTEYLVEKGMPHVKFPLWICPILIRKGFTRIEASICIHPDPEIETIYLCMGSFPFEKKDGAVLLEVQGGIVHGVLGGKRNYENTLMNWLGKRKIPPEYAYAISVVWKEISNLLSSGQYFLEREVPENHVVFLPNFNEEIFGNEFSYNNEMPIPEPVLNPQPTIVA